jgi:hypothetical protein
MAPPRKPSGPDAKHFVRLRLPDDVFRRLDDKARNAARPFNRTVINELAAFPHFDGLPRLAELVGAIETLLSRFGARLTAIELGDELLRALDAALAARTNGQLQSQLDRLRVLRSLMLESERQTATKEREQLAAHIKQLERKIVVIETLPTGSVEKDDLPSLKAELARLRQTDSGAAVEPKSQRPKRAKAETPSVARRERETA